MTSAYSPLARPARPPGRRPLHLRARHVGAARRSAGARCASTSTRSCCPIVVLMELEAKRNHPELGWAARQAPAHARAAAARARLAHRARCRSTTTAARCGSSSTTSRTAGPARRRMTADNNDHRILAVAHNLAAEGRDVTVVTKDLPLRLKASIVGLDADEYRNELAADTRWTGFVELDVEPDVIDELFAERERRPRPRPRELPVQHRRRAPRRLAVGPRPGARRQAGAPRPRRPSAVRRRGRSAEQRIALDLLADPSVGIVQPRRQRRHRQERAGPGRRPRRRARAAHPQADPRVPPALRRRRPGPRLPARRRGREDGPVGRRGASTPSSPSPAPR